MTTPDPHATAAAIWQHAVAAAETDEPRAWTKAELAALEVDGEVDLWMDESEKQTAERRYERWLDRAGIA